MAYAVLSHFKIVRCQAAALGGRRAARLPPLLRCVPALAIWIVGIKLHALTVGGKASRADRLPQESFYLLQQRSADVLLTSAPNGVEASGAFFAAQSLQLLDCCGLPDVLTKDGNVDVFRESLDQALAFR